MINYKIKFRTVNHSEGMKTYEAYIRDKILRDGNTYYIIETENGGISMIEPVSITKILEKI
jgi:hypothetical protein